MRAAEAARVLLEAEADAPVERGALQRLRGGARTRRTCFFRSLSSLLRMLSRILAAIASRSRASISSHRAFILIAPA